MQSIRRKFGLKYPVEPLVYAPEEWEAAKGIGRLYSDSLVKRDCVIWKRIKQ